MNILKNDNKQFYKNNLSILYANRENTNIDEYVFEEIANKGNDFAPLHTSSKINHNWVITDIINNKLKDGTRYESKNDPFILHRKDRRNSEKYYIWKKLGAYEQGLPVLYSSYKIPGPDEVYTVEKVVRKGGKRKKRKKKYSKKKYSKKKYSKKKYSKKKSSKKKSSKKKSSKKKGTKRKNRN